ncbi:hypothetical protein SD81_030920 [Tolypothrix campylonemoides VB511288]|nr:hypothetical protein SD81_030920 [Tolypothrix campylonemoides VB511288]
MNFEFKKGHPIPIQHTSTTGEKIMKAQIVEQVEFFSEAELQSLEFVPEELEAIEAERVPDLDSISFEEVAKDLEAYFEGGVEEAALERRGGRRGGGRGGKKPPKDIINQHNQSRPKWPKVDFNINKNKVTKLLMNTTNSGNKELSRKAKFLLTEMSRRNWQVLAGGHSGGLGGKGRPADQNPHITLQVGNVTYHLRYIFKHGQMLLTHITP